MALRRCYGCMRMVEGDTCPHCGHRADESNQPHQLPAGTILKGQYQVGKVLGQGGFGITYIGLDIHLDLVVAIKEFYHAAAVNRDTSQTLMVQLNTEEARMHYHDSRERFLREAQALAKMQHVPEIVGVRGFFEENNTAYIIMDFVDGMDLRNYVKKRGGRIPAEELLLLMEPVMRALDTIHKGGLVHRDISPDNIMVLPNGKVKILDFGAVRAVDNLDADADLTHSTEAILKHGFAPMEQYRSRGNLGPWTDQYGLCASIYYCLTGKVPPDAPARAMGDEDVNWDAVPGLTAQQRQVLNKGMAMLAKNRFPDMEALRSALYDGTYEEKKPDPKPEPAPNPKPTKPKRFGWVAALLMVAALGGGAFWFLNRETPEPVVEAVPTETEPTETQPTETFPLETQAPETEPDETEPMETEMQSVESESEEQPWKQNMLSEDVFNMMGIDVDKLYAVTFLDTLKDAPENAIDVSVNQDGSVLGWLEWTVGTNLVIAGEGGINGAKCSEAMFSGFDTLNTVTFGGAFHTEDATSLASMFRNCFMLETVDVENLDVSNVQDMSFMFCISRGIQVNINYHGIKGYVDYEYDDLSAQVGTAGIESLNMETWDTSNVENMRDMFRGRNFLHSPKLSNWDVSNVKDMRAMFHGCVSLEELDLSGWDVSSVELTDYMFWNCTSLKKLNTEGWEFTKLANGQYMFYNCDKLQTLDVSQWNLSKVRFLQYMFSGCSNLNGLDVAEWKLLSLNDAQGMMEGCRSVSYLDVGDWNPRLLVNASSMFAGCSSMKELDVSQWEISCVTNMRDMFKDCSSLEQLNTSDWDVSRVVDMHGMFADCVNLRDLDVRDWDVSEVRDMSEMFYNCSEYLDLDVYYWDISNVTSFLRFMSDGRQLNGRDWGAFFWDNDLK